MRIELPVAQRQPHRRRHALGRGRAALRPCRPARDTISVQLTGTAGQSFGAFLARGVSLELIGRRQRLCRQGPVGRPRRRAPARGLQARSAGEHHRRQHGALWRHRRRGLFRGRRGRALRRAQLRRGLRRRRHRRPWLRIHDRRRRGRAGRDRPQLRGRHVGRRRLCLRPGRRASSELCNPAMVELETVAPVGRRRRTPARPRQRAVGVEDNGMGDMLRFDAERLRILVERHLLHTGSARARELLDNWDEALKHFVKVMPTDYAPRAARHAGRASAAKPSRRSRVQGAAAMGKPTGFLEIERKDRGYEKPEARLKTLAGIRPAAAAEPRSRSRRARCMDCGIPFCHNGCPVNNLIPDWNDLVCRDQLAGRARDPALDQQLPGIHRPHLPRALRGVLHAEHRRQPGDHQDRSNARSSIAAGKKAGSSRCVRRAARPARASPSSAPARPAWPAPSSSRAPAIR